MTESHIQKHRIIFVDDEPRVIQGLKRMLHKMGGEWEIAFAQDGPEALALLDHNTFDVIVSDMKMPGLDGAGLLAEVQKRHPRMVRIVLSGLSSDETILKATGSAHQFLLKPCEPELLKRTISRACTLRDLLDNEVLGGIVSRTESLPSLPDLYGKLMKEIRASEGSLQRVGEIVESDLSMSAKLVQLVSSAFFGLPRKISSPSEAVMLLGLETVKSLALTMGLFSKFDESTLSFIPIKQIYEHSMKTGIMAREIAKIEGADEEMVGETFMTGLLHDVGKLLLGHNIPEVYRGVFELSAREGIPFPEAEMTVLGATHGEVGAFLLGLLGLSDAVVEGVAFHHCLDKSSVKDFEPLIAVHVASAVLDSACQSETDAALKAEIDFESLERLGLKDRLSPWIEACREMESG
jgi:HD-like signal output (HDOD) protein/ActR/RegA family two-component response regulator